jgi:hypothetical protein
MSNLMDAFGTDLELEKEGVWVELLKDVLVKVRPLGNDRYLRLVEKLKSKHSAAYRSGTIDPEIDRNIQIRAVAKEVLVDWKGVEDPDTGEELPYSYDNAKRLLSDKRIKRFGIRVIEASAEQETFRQYEEEETEKNSGKSLRGNSNGKR